MGVGEAELKFSNRRIFKRMGLNLVSVLANGLGNYLQLGDQSRATKVAISVCLSFCIYQ